MDGHASPNDVVQAYAAQARARGVRIVEDTPVTGIVVERGRVAGVLTPAGPIATRLVVNAAGPWAPLVGRMAGLALPVDPRRRHIFVTDAFDGIRHPMPLVTDTGSGFYCRSEQGAILMSPGDIGATTEYEAQVDWSMLELAVEKAMRRIPALEGAQVRHAWAGLRPLTPDGRAILDWAPGVEGLYLAVGFCGHGFQHSPAVGETVAEVLLDGRSTLDIQDLRLGPLSRRLDTAADRAANVPSPRRCRTFLWTVSGRWRTWPAPWPAPSTWIPSCARSWRRSSRSGRAPSAWCAWWTWSGAATGSRPTAAPTTTRRTSRAWPRSSPSDAG